MKKVIILIMILSICLIAQIPQTLSYQGILTDNNGTVVPDGDYNLTFSLYDVETGGSPIWTETQSVTITGGIINVILGKVTALNLLFDNPYWLAITVGTGTEMTPRIELTSSAYSMKAQTVADSIITSSSIANNTVLRSINNLKDDVNLSGGDNINISVSSDSLIISATGLANGDITSVAAGMGLEGGGDNGDIALYVLGGTGLSVGDSVLLDVSYTDSRYINEGQNNAINENMIQEGNVVKSINGLQDNVFITEGNNITVTNINDSVITISATTGSGGNTLDGAYDQGGPGLGRSITADAGAFEVNGYDGVLFTGEIDSGVVPVEGWGVRMMWYPGKAALRAGRVTGDYWNDVNIGENSVAFGANAMARGASSVAAGQGSASWGNYSVAMGYGAEAFGGMSVSMGRNTYTSGGQSIAFGDEARTFANHAIALGQEIDVWGENSMGIALSDQNGIDINQDNTMAILGGNVGIGTATPTTALEVADTIFASSGGFKFPDGSVQTTAASGSGTGNTLDQAYDQGGAGAGRTITADAGAFEVNGVDGVVFNGTILNGTIPVEGAGTRMMWYPNKVAFRAGRVLGTQWDDANIGNYSTVFGANSIANGDYSTIFGLNNTASGTHSLAVGGGSTASGEYATAIGSGTIAQSYASLAFGRNNVDTGTFGSWVDSDFILTIGDGILSTSRSNSLTFSKNGYMWIQGTLTQNSDRNLKSNIQLLPNALQNLQKINGVSYKWKDTEQMGTQTEIGVIAQDVEKVYPELVGENEGYKTTNYIGLIPVLIEAVKEQQKMIELLQQRISELENK
jgi:hypothetical protein